MMSKKDYETPMYSIGIAKDMTDLTGRQIRYYEEVDLIKPARTKGNQRIYSLKDIERLKEIKSLLDKGLNIAGIKEKIGTADEIEEEKKDKAYDRRPLTTLDQQKGGLTSLYPVSDRAKLLKILDEELETEDDE